LITTLQGKIEFFLVLICTLNANNTVTKELELTVELLETNPTAVVKGTKGGSVATNDNKPT
jgi:hypothetical protein